MCAAWVEKIELLMEEKPFSFVSGLVLRLNHKFFAIFLTFRFLHRARPNDAKKNPQGLPHVIYCRLWRWPDLSVRRRRKKNP